MEQAFIDKMQAQLEEQKEQILKSLADKHSEYKKMVESGEPGDEVDIASDVIDGALLESLGAQDANRLTMINNALDRIQQGKYGLCLKCHKEIPLERLEAIPYAFMCISCKTENERRNRQFLDFAEFVAVSIDVVNDFGVASFFCKHTRFGKGAVKIF